MNRKRAYFQLLVLIIASAVIFFPFILVYVNRDRNNNNITALHRPSDWSSSSVLTPLDPAKQRQQQQQTLDINCLTLECINRVASTIARVYPTRLDRHWCLSASSPHQSAKDANGNWQGLILIKVPKGASSTSAGVAIRIARRNNCQVMWMHRLAVEYQNHSTSKSFFFSTIRDPASRAVSTIFFHYISRLPDLVVNDATMMSLLRKTNDNHVGAVSEGQGGFQLRYTSFQNILPNSAWNESVPTMLQNPHQIIKNVRETLGMYGFFLVTERMDESLVAMSLILGIDVGDVLVTSSKVAGSRYHFVKKPHEVFECLPTVKSYTTQVIDAFLASDEWRAMNYGDYLLHAAANQSLDLTINTIGRERFDKAYAKYTRLKNLEKKKCAPYVDFPCDSNGTAQPKKSRQSCYLPFYDFGCGFKCIDRLINADERQQLD